MQTTTAAPATPEATLRAAPALRTIQVPAIGALWPEQGGIYAGIVGGDHLLILGPAAPSAMTWHAAKRWIRKINETYAGTPFGDWSLPTRAEQALLYANCEPLFRGQRYWSCEQHADDDSYAWCQYFDNGGQYYDRKDDELRARAVRRLPI